MALVAPNEGDAQIVNLMLGKATSENLTLKLFTNNIAPGKTDTATTYTEASGSGYAAQTLTGSNWTVTPGVGNNPAVATYPQQTFTFTGALTVYGYYVVGATSGKLYWAEGFGSAYTFPAGGGTLQINLQFGEN